MHRFVLLSLFAAASTLLQAEQNAVEAFVSGITPQIDLPLFISAQVKAAAVLQRSGIRVSWHRGRIRGCGPHSGRVQIEFLEAAPEAASESALAATHPNTCPVVIRLYWDRIRKITQVYPFGRRVLLGNVLAHEIIHTLDGGQRHSKDGLMKSLWTNDDLIDMVE